MRPPICEICDADVDPSGGLVTFQPDEESRDWHRRAEQEGFVGHPPDVGWFCAEHVDAAREAARTMPFGAGVRSVAEDRRTTELDARVATAPDLVGVRLGRGRLETSEEFDQRRVAWDLPGVEVGRLLDELTGTLDELCTASTMGTPTTLTASTERSWSPIDGVEPPNCPFVDTHRATGVTSNGAIIRLEHELAHWSPDEVNTATVHCSITSPSGSPVVAISAFGDNPGGRRLTTLWLQRPTNASIVGILDALVGRFHLVSDTR